MGEVSDCESRIVPMRLQKFLARAGAASRRGSENLMTAGRVTVNGKVVTELGSKVDPLVEVAVDGAVVRLADGPVTIMLHKPAGFVTTMSDPQGRRTVAELVPTERYPGLFPIGRLDFDTTGLLLFSTDGELGNGLLHPKHHVTKRYLACVEGRPTERDLALLRRGIELDDGPTCAWWRAGRLAMPSVCWRSPPPCRRAPRRSMRPCAKGARRGAPSCAWASARAVSAR